MPTGESSYEAGTLLIYPNPATDVIRISGINGMAELTVYSLQGNPVLQRMVEADQLVSLNSLSEGMYVVTVKTSKGTMVRKIVKR